MNSDNDEKAGMHKFFSFCWYSILELNCVPFIEILESKLVELKKFYLTIEKRVERLSSSLESDQGEVNQKMSFLGTAFDEVFENFANLNQVSEKISGSAIRIGKQIESIQNERNRAEEAREILGYFLEYNASSKCSKIDSLIPNNSYDLRLKLAGYLRKLNHIAKAAIPGAENVLTSSDFSIIYILIFRGAQLLKTNF